MLLSLWSDFWSWSGTEPTPGDGCFIELETGGYILLEDNSGYIILEQCEDAFQIIHGPGNGPWHRDWRIDHANEKYRAAKERERIKEEEIIRLKLEAQDSLMRQRELQALADLNSKRQLLALKQAAAIREMIMQEELAKLVELQRLSMIYRNNLAFLVLAMSTPFGIGGTMN